MDDTDRIGSSTAPPASHFPATRPSLVEQAAHGDPETAARAIRELCAIYHEPIRHWLARNLPQVRERDDAVQGFVEHLLQQNRFRNFQWGTAKFRSFLSNASSGICGASTARGRQRSAVPAPNPSTWTMWKSASRPRPTNLSTGNWP